MEKDTKDENPLLTTKQAAELLGFSPRLLECRRLKGDGPPYVRISRRGVRYRSQDIAAWVSERVFKSTTEEDRSNA